MAMSTGRCCHIRGASGVSASLIGLEKCFLHCCTLPVLAEELLMVPGRWGRVLSQLAVAGLSPGEWVAQKLREQQALILTGAVLLGLELSRRAVFPVLWQRLRCQKMRKKPYIARMLFKSSKKIFPLHLSAICKINTSLPETHA